MATAKHALATAVLVALATGCGIVDPGGGPAVDPGTGAVGATAAPAVDGPAAPDDAWAGVVTHVSDGDTLWVEVTASAPGGPPVGEEVKLRLLRIDTPELARDGQPGECLAEAAKQHLRGLLPEGTHVLAAYDVEAQDRFGRDLVHLWTTEGRWINGTMLADGFARVVTFPPNDAFTDEVLAAERDAREAGRGLWSDAACGGADADSSRRV